MRKKVQFKQKYIAELCQMDLENEMLKTEDIVEENGKYTLFYYVNGYVQEGRANTVIRRYTIG